MKHLLQCAALALLFVLFPFSISAKVVGSGICGTNLTWSYDDETHELKIEGKGSMSNFPYDAPWYNYRSEILTLSLPSELTSIGELAFRDCSGLTSVTIPNSVTSIGELAFRDCSGLTSVTIPNSVTSIGDRAFSGCSGLTSVTIPNSVTSIGSHAFGWCSGLTSVTIPNSVTSTGSGAFEGCSGLTSVTIPNSVTSIGGFAFCGCSGLTSVTIPNSVTSIGSSAFSGCSGLTSVTIPNSVTSIEDYAFRECSGLVNPIYVNNLFVFLPPTYKGKYIIPDGIETIVGGAFYGCSGLTSVTIPNSVTSIGSSAFSGCSGLTSVTIPNSVTSIGSSTFRGCSSLTSVTNLSETPQEISSSVFSLYATLHVLPGCKAAYEAADYWKKFTIVEDAVVPDNNLDIADGTVFTNADEYTVSKLTYTRTFNNTDWQPLYIPFSMEYKDWASQGLEVAYINGFYEYDDDKNGTVDRSALEVIMVTEGEGRLIPNYPYLVRSKETGSKVLTLDNAELHPAEANSIDCSTVRTKYIFTGTYASVSQAELNAKGAYIMSGGSLKPSAGALKPMRWYMLRESRGNQLLPLLADIKVYVRGEEDEADALDFANEEKAEGQAYNLMGQKVSRDAKGIKIINGRKYVK